ncbi:uncharacterized protein LOC130641708 [Hydractinia symbiolongicarpus]|uniref:uncharacterized protein LOC130641708 n=1 Tax=Hydractinia symbiolongicarpus TaxID=13093 RepID=UPI00254C9768|nr:uncharacterized protein LOC130641708 [Hydractinia symbiolongicarpus]
MVSLVWCGSSAGVVVLVSEWKKARFLNNNAILAATLLITSTLLPATLQRSISKSVNSSLVLPNTSYTCAIVLNAKNEALALQTAGNIVWPITKATSRTKLNLVKLSSTECSNDAENPTKFLRFILIDYVDNTDQLSNENIEEILLEKEKFWIGTVCAIHLGLNGFHDWRRTKRIQKHLIGDW